MKPSVFLSHSKEDRALIERIANDLRDCRINVWYDEWEIPPGVSFRRKIFEEGIPQSDLFLVYLTPHSLASYWVAKELDAAFVLESQGNGGGLALFVDSEATRSQMSADMQALHSPLMDSDVYERPLRQLISRAHEAAAAKSGRELQKLHDLESHALSAQVGELEAKLEVLASQTADSGVSKAIAHLQSTVLRHRDQDISLAEVFRIVVNSIATGADHQLLAQYLYQRLPGPKGDPRSLSFGEAMGDLVILGLVRTIPPSREYDSFLYQLTDFGALVARQDEIRLL